MKAGQSEANSLRGEKAVEMAGGSGSNGLFPWKLPTLAGPVLIFIMQSPCSCAIHLCDGGQLAPCDPLSDAVCSFVVVFFPPKIRQQRGHGQLLALGCASAKLDRTLLSFFWVVVFFFISSESFGDGAALQGLKESAIHTCHWFPTGKGEGKLLQRLIFKSIVLSIFGSLLSAQYTTLSPSVCFRFISYVTIICQAPCPKYFNHMQQDVWAYLSLLCEFESLHINNKNRFLFITVINYPWLASKLLDSEG